MALTGLTKVTNIGINTTTIPTLGGSRNTGVVTASNFIGDGSGLSNITGSGSGVIVRDGGSLVGTAGSINFGTNLSVSAISAGIVTVTNAVSATALTNLSDVTVSSASNGQILKHNGSAFVNVADTTYSQSSVASGSNVNLRLSDGSTDDDILITAGSNITFSSVSAGGFTIAASGGGGGGLSNVVEDTTPELGGNLNLNNKFITGSGGVNVSGVTTSTSFVGNITGNVTGNADTATSATTATNVTVSANNSTDETVYPIFVDGATGGQGAESDTGLNYNPSTGNLTAVKFTGSGVALTGVVTSIVAGSNISLAGGPTGIVTISSSGGGGLSLSSGADNRVITASSATALNGESNLTFNGTTLALTGSQTISADLDVDGHTELDNVNIAGVSTFGNNITASGTSRFEIASMENGVLDGEISHNGDATTKIKFETSIIKLDTAGTTRLNINNSGANITGVTTSSAGFSGNLTGNVTGNADTATTATNVTVSANNSTNETVYPIFVDGATGAQGAESDTGLSYNPNSGALTSGSFVKSGGSSSQFLKADGSVDGSTYLTSGSYLENVSEDSSPQLGADLDLNSKNITGTGNAQIVGVITATSAVKTWTLGASGSSHYTFTGDGFTSATNDPDIYLERGKRYAFLNNSGGSHPFQIRVSNGGSAYSTGVTNNGASSGYITFNVPWDAPATLYYQCTAHSGMGGNIYIRGGASVVTYESAKELQLGNNTTSTSVNTANLVNIDLGGTHHDTAGTAGKLKLWKDASDEMSLGVSSNQMDFILTSGSYSYNFYGGNTGATRLMQLNQTGNIQLVLGNESTSGVAAPLTLNLGGTYSSSAGNGNDLSAKLKMWTNGSDVMGFSVSGNQLDYIVTSENYDHVFYGGNAGTTELARFEGTGDLKFPNGKGINFSATEGSGATTSVLDDYEEGVFTPTLTGGTAANNMYYTKIGRVVHISGSLAFNSISGQSGNMTIGGLPYASINGLDSYTHLAAHAYDSLNVGNNTYQFQTLRVNEGTTNMMIIIPAGNGSIRTFAQYSHVDSSTFRFRVAGYYITA